MAKVLCSLVNASTLINGVNFTPTDGGMVSDDIDQDTADAFTAIPGYSAIPDAPAAPLTKAQQAAAKAAAAAAGNA